MDSAIHWVNLFPVDKAIGLIFLVTTRGNVSVRSRSNWNWKCWFLRRGETESKYPEKNVSERGRKPTTKSTHIWRQCQNSNPRATLMGREHEIRLLKRQDEGALKECSSSRIHYVLLFLLVDELPYESVERKSQMFSSLIFLAIIWLCIGGSQADLYPVYSQSPVNF